MTDSEIQEILLMQYPFNSISKFRLLKDGVSNKNYEFSAGDNKYIARLCLFEPDNQLRSMIPFLKHAEKSDYPAARIIQATDGRDFIKFSNTPLIVTTFIEGDTANSFDIENKHLASLAKLVAKFHKLEWEPSHTPLTLNPDYIFGVYDEIKDEHINDKREDTLRLIELVDIYYEKFKAEKFTEFSKKLPQGLTHGDIIPGNVMFENDRAVSLIDFEEMGISWQLQDVAMILITWTSQDNDLNKDYIKLFIKEYENHRHLEQIERENIEYAMKFIAFRQCVYAKRMLLRGRLKNIKEFSSYRALSFLHENKLDL